MTNTVRRIYVIESGWVLAGFEQTTSPHTSNEVHITDAVCVRRWGTTGGLGQLALHGPTEKTILDPCGEVRISTRHVLYRIECPGWK